MKKGSIILNVARVMYERELPHHETWLTQHGFTRGEARTVLRKYHRLLMHLKRLCELFDCTPEAFLDWEGDADHPLNALKKPQRKRLAKLFEGRSQKEVDALLDELERKLRDGG